jgi:O-antigen ligase
MQAIFLLAVAVPTLLAFNLPPSATLVNQCIALGLWGALAAALYRPSRFAQGTIVLQASLALLGLGAAVQMAGALPVGILAAALAMLLATGLIVAVGAEAARRDGADALAGYAYALLIAGALSAIIGCIQVFAPHLADGDWIARSSIPGRAIGNLRQPNHLSSLLLCALIAWVALRELGRLRASVAWPLAVLLLFGLVLSGSRTGIVGVGVLALWGLLDRRLSRAVRVALLASPLLFAAMWFGIAAWSHATAHVFGAEGRLLPGHGDISSSRFAIWSNTLAMIAQQPWTGVGFGEFNLAWTLTAFPQRPTAFFDHTHNLPLQLLVELGVPLGSLVFALLLFAVVQAARSAWAYDGVVGTAKRAAFMVVLMMGLHSMLEYPLWYAYFLLPTAFAWGYALSRPASRVDSVAVGEAVAQPPPNRAFALAGLALVIGVASAALDYRRIVVIYDPPEFSLPLEERIASGQRSLLFGHHADYAAATAFGPPKAPLSPMQELAFKRAPHQLLDARLMIAWSQALAAQGDLDKARWLAARLREFRNPGADEYFAPCSDPAQAAQAFQCQLPTREVHWREFTQR